MFIEMDSSRFALRRSAMFIVVSSSRLACRRVQRQARDLIELPTDKGFGKVLKGCYVACSKRITFACHPEIWRL
jgi:hypothetical protein